MPYVSLEKQVLLSAGAKMESPGDLTYVIQQALKRYLEEHYHDYTTMAAILGALDGARLDFYTRIIEPYEKQKINKNGDVWT